jgi:general secretion pathway protein K
MTRSLGTQRGVALLSVLLIVAIVSALLYHLLDRHSLVVAQTRQALAGNQALSYALGAEAYARQLLVEDWTDVETRAFDALTEAWAQPLQPFEIDGGHLEVWIEDLEGRFNLNSLAAGDAGRSLQRLRELFAAAGVQPELADAWKDWVDADADVTGFGAEDGEYLMAEPPHRTPNQRAADASELMWLAALDAESYAKLEPLVVALPDSKLRINVNTANAPTLTALSSRIPLTRAEALVESPREYTSMQAATAEIPELTDAADSATVTSTYFEIHARAEIGGSRADLTSIVYRDPQSGTITLLERDLGTRFVSRFVPADAPSATEDAT